MKMLKRSIFVIAIMVFGMQVHAQDRPDPNTPQGENLKVPDGWQVRLDRPNDEIMIGADPDSSDIYFVNMTPGWHITTGPAGIYYHPGNKANGTYTLKTVTHLFNPGNRNREAFGLFFGGKKLGGEEQEYTYFLIRNTGEFLLKKRTGEETEVIHEWTESEAINIYDDPEVSSVKNELQVELSKSKVNFYINGAEVLSVDKGNFNTNGIYGMRVNHAINLHISDLGIVMKE